MTRNHTSEEPSGKKGRGCCGTTALVVAGVCLLVAILVGVFWGQRIKQGVQVARTWQAAQHLTEEQIPALRQDFPFDPNNPPAIDAERFARYCRARAKLYATLPELTPHARAIANLRLESKEDIPQALEVLGPTAPVVQALIANIEPALRDAEMNPDEFVHITRETWAGFSYGARRGRDLAQQVIRNILNHELARQYQNASTGEVSDFLREWLTERRVTGENRDAWTLIQQHADIWTGPAAWYLADLALIDQGDEIAENR